MEDKIRISGYFDEKLYKEVQNIMGKEKRKLAPMLEILVQEAVKERKVKSKNK